MTRWTTRAACSDTDPELFFPISAAEERYVVDEVCMPCPVRGECLEYAFESESWFGVFGGMTSEQRRVLARKTPVFRR